MCLHVCMCAARALCSVLQVLCVVPAMRHRRPLEDADIDSGTVCPAPLKCQGLADEETDAPAAGMSPSGPKPSPSKAQRQLESSLGGAGSGHIGAFYPGMDDEDTKASCCQPSFNCAVCMLLPDVLYVHAGCQPSFNCTVCMQLPDVLYVHPGSLPSASSCDAADLVLCTCLTMFPCTLTDCAGKHL